MKRIFIIVLIMAIGSGFFVGAYAELYYRGTDNDGYRLIYDSDFDITWYDYSKTEDMWAVKVNWADTLTVNFAGYSYEDWRLPTTLQPDYSCSNQQWDPFYYGFNCTGSEMGHLYYTALGNTETELGYNTSGDFLYLLRDHFYWSGTDYEPSRVPRAWVFDFYNGNQVDGKGKDKITNNFYGIAVRDGDVPQQETEPVKIRRLTDNIDYIRYNLNFYYYTLLDAYVDAIDGNIIQCRAGLLTEDLDFDLNKSVVIEGGYNYHFTVNDGTTFTSINGSIVISDGKVTIDNGNLEIL